MEKILKIIKEKSKKKENLIAFLIILVITLIIINSIIKDDDNEQEKNTTYIGAEFATTASAVKEESLEKKLEKILGKMNGVSDVSVLITYSSSNENVPIYNEKNNISVTEETDANGGTRIIEENESEKTVVSGSDSNPVAKITNYPQIEGAVVMAKGAGNSNVKANIISAVEAVTGLAKHKIQVFEAKK